MAKNEAKAGRPKQPKRSRKPPTRETARARIKSPQSSTRSRPSTRARHTTGGAELTALLQLTHESAIVRDLQNRITFWNRGAAERYGWSEGEVLGQTAHDLLKTVFPEPIGVITRVLMEKGHWEGELVHTRRNGTRITVASRWALQCNAKGKPVAILEINNDTSERARSEERVERLASFPELNPSPVIEVDASGNITFANPATWRTLTSLGIEPDDVHTLLPVDLGGILTNWDQESTTVHNRQVVVKDRVFGETVALIPQFKAARIYAYDITERKRAEEALRETQMQFQALVETTSDFIWEMDARGRYTYCSPQLRTLWDLDPKEMVGKSPFDLLVPEDRERASRTFSALAASAAPFRDMEVHSFDARGDVRVLEISGVPFRGAAGELKGFRGITRDITERKRAEAALSADLAALERMHGLSAPPGQSPDIQALLQETMDTAVAVVQADQGTLQLLDGDTLNIVAHHGHERPFLDFFAAAENVASVCGEATRRGERVVVPDVETSPIFSGTPSLAVLRAAGVRAVQSTPLMTRSGRLLGILTTQWARPHTPNEHNLWRLDLLARQAADLIEQRLADAALRESEEKYRDLVESSNSIIMRADKDLNIIYMNPFGLRFFGYTAEELIGKNAVGTTIPVQDDSGADLAAMAHDIARNPEKYRTNVHQNMRKNGQLVWVSWTNKVNCDHDGNVVDILAIGNDISERRRAQEELARVNQLLSYHVENSPLAVIEWGPDMQLTRWSGAAEQIFGWNADEVLGKRMEDFRWVYKDDESKVAEVSAVLQHGTNPKCLSANRNYRKDGSVIDCEWYNSSLIDASGKMRSILSLVLDVTERKRAEEQLATSEERYRSLFSAMDEGFALHEMTLDDHGKPIDYRFLEINPAFERLTGLTREQVIGNLMTSVLPSDDPRWIEIYGKVALSGESIRFENYSTALRRHYEVFAYSPAPRQFATIFTDITERKRSEEALADSNRKLSQVLESIQDDFYVIDRDWRFAFTSTSFAARVGKKPKDFVGNCIWEMFPKHLGTLFEENMRATMEKRETRRFEVPGKYTDAWYSMTTFPSPEGVIVLGTDITARKRAEDQVQQHNAILSGINRIFERALTSMTDEELGLTCLRAAEEVTGSKFGFIGELNAQGTLDDIAISDPGWELCRMMPRTESRRAPVNFKIHGLYGRVIADGKGYFTNDPSGHPDSIGLPEGHPPLTAFLGVPLIHDGKTIGMIGLGNREGGYRDEDLTAADLLATAAVQALMRKRAEQAMQESEKREHARSDELAAILNAVPAAVWITQDPAARYISGNRVAQEWMRTTEGVNMSLSAPVGERPATFALFKDGVELPPDEMPVQRAARGEEIRDSELEMRYPDGTVRTVVGNATPLRDSTGKFYGAVSAFIDITQRKHVQVALQQAMDVLEKGSREIQVAREDAESERRLLQAVMDALPVGMAIFDEHGGDLRSNQAYKQVWGAPRPSVESVADYTTYRAWWAGTTKPVAPEEWAAAVAIQKGEAVVGQLLEIQRFDGTRAWVLNSASPVRDANGKIIGSAVAVQDITELRRAEESLREAMHRIQKLNADMEQRSHELEIANEELERLAMSLAYDLRAPLISINSISSAILQDYQSVLPSEAAKLFELIHANTKEMDQLTNGLVRLMRITRQPVHKQTTDMMGLIREVWDATAAERHDRPVELTMRLLPPCEGDPVLLREVWSNLISNALKFTRGRTPARIEIGTRWQENRMVYFIRDNGAGFDMAYAGRIFRAFQRYHHPEEFEGAGVGLAIVEGIIRRHGGRVWAEGNVEQGATFYLAV